MLMVRESKGSKTSFGVQLATWEVNPTLKKDSTFIAERYRINHSDAERDYGANPPRNANPYISSMGDVAHNFDISKSMGLRVKYKYIKRDSAIDYKFAELTRSKGCLFPTILSLDAGIVKDSFALTISGFNNKGNKIIYALVEVSPDKGKNNIHLPSIFRLLLLPLIDKYNVKLVVSDRWQQYKLLQDLEEEGKVDIESYSLTYSDMQDFKIAITDPESPYIIPSARQLPTKEKDGEDVIDYAKIEHMDVIDGYPKMFEGKPSLHLAYQLLYVKDDGRTLSKSVAVTDDLLRSAILANHFLDDEDIVEKYTMKSGLSSGVRKTGSSGVIGKKSGGTKGRLRGSRVGIKR